MIGVLVNTATVIIGSLIGLIFKRGIPKKLTDAVMIGIGLCTVYIGISGALKGENTLILIGSIVLGAVLGTALDLDRRLNGLGELIGRRFKKSAYGSVSVAEGFVTASLLFCIGAMTIVGSLDAGLTGDNKMLFTKSVLDFVSSAILSVSLGIGVICAAAFVFVFQGAIVLLAQYLRPVLTASAINEMTCAGSLIIVALGLNILGVTKIKVANYLPAIVFAPVLCWLVTLFH
ncbi:hypothetical protein SAMN02745823_03406 [Sporobacter termitidis DSM 10068]|uniref:DUF554 domain-containing protein n=1 Tax=Sporobacter termitidis DSM 10068 TaxID=1123282 RepID=A0A1M5Z9K1_9FIRM|nr:DUF554 domain-containing protein [Sporobacter termitidis]SHI20798.1 hypothetical protein SAMN02745823_03406 [Sporobacter termitidis DSM 10068]